MSEVRVLAWWLLVRPPPGSQVGWVGLEGGQTVLIRALTPSRAHLTFMTSASPNHPKALTPSTTILEVGLQPMNLGGHTFHNSDL